MRIPISAEKRKKCRKYRGGFFASKHRMTELLYAIKEAIDLLSNLQKRDNSYTRDVIEKDGILHLPLYMALLL